MADTTTVTREQALKILNGLRNDHREDNWMRPNALSWDESHVQETTGKTLAEFERELKAEGYASFEDFFVASLMNESTLS